MNNEIVLIIPDIHHKVDEVEKIIRSVGADKVIFLGDYFDNIDDTPEVVKYTCDWLVHSVKMPNRIHLFGNHDVHYAFPYKKLECTGYEQWKYWLIQDITENKIWNNLKWFYFLNNRWLLTHAGLHRNNVPDKILQLKNDRKNFIENISNWLKQEIRIGLNKIANNQYSWIFNAGKSRNGPFQVGGITWCDFNREFLCVPGINQIVGHSPQLGEPNWNYLSESGMVVHYKASQWTPPSGGSSPVGVLDNPKLSSNICLEVVGNMHWMIWNGKTVEIGNYRNL